MPLYSAAFRAAVADLGARAIPVASFTWPAPYGVERYTTDAGRGLAGLSGLAPRILAADGLSFAAGLRPGGITFPGASILMANTDRHITRILEGGVDPRNSVVSLQWALAGLATADWHTQLLGLYDHESYEDKGQSVRLHIRAQDAPMHGQVPKAQILESEAPNALPESLGVYMPLVWGSHDSEALTGRGMVPAINWEYTPGWRYVVALGWLKAVNRVYLDGTLKTLTTDYTISHPIVGGKLITSIDFVAEPGETAVVTADVEGYESVGDGSGDLILNPVEQLRHFLANFGFSDWRHGVLIFLQWNDPADYPIDLDTFAISAADSATFAFEGSLYLGGDAQTESVLDVVQRWLGSWLRYRAYWTEGAGQIALRPLDHRHFGYESPGPVLSTDDVAPFFRGAVHEFGFSPSRDTSRLVRRVDLSHLPGAADEKLFSSFAVQDLSQTEQTGESFDLTCSASRIL